MPKKNQSKGLSTRFRFATDPKPGSECQNTIVYNAIVGHHSYHLLINESFITWLVDLLLSKNNGYQFYKSTAVLLRNCNKLLSFEINYFVSFKFDVFKLIRTKLEQTSKFSIEAKLIAKYFKAWLKRPKQTRIVLHMYVSCEMNGFLF